MSVYNPFDFFLEPHAQSFPFTYDDAQQAELAPYLVTEPATPLLAAYLEEIDRTPMVTIDFLVALNQRVQGDVSYLIRMEPGVQTPEETLTTGSGSCRDSGWLLVQLLRHLGLAARFASGYLIQLARRTKWRSTAPAAPRSTSPTCTPGARSICPAPAGSGSIPTSGLLGRRRSHPAGLHAATPSSAAPISGAVDESEVEFEHEMAVTRICESPRVTKPYTDEQWATRAEARASRSTPTWQPATCA